MGSYVTTGRHSCCYLVLLIILISGCIIQSGIGDEPLSTAKERFILYAEPGFNTNIDPSLLNLSISGITIVLNEPELGFIVVESPVNESHYYQNEFSKLPWISMVEVDGKRYMATYAASPDDPEFSDQWALNRTHVQDAWNISSSHPEVSNITVAVLDTGVDIHHEDIFGFIGQNGFDWISNGSEMHDPDGHGTFLAGLVSATQNNGKGICGISHALIIPERVGTNASGVFSSVSAAAIKHAADQGARIILMGYGGSGQSMAEESAIQYATKKGSVLIAPAGNGISNEAHYPSDYDNVISVGSTSKTDGLSYYSNYGIFIDLVAPGENIISTWKNNSYYTAAGTSVAAGIVAGTAALILQEDSSLKPDEVSEIFCSSTLDLGRTGKDIYYGYGLLDISAAIKKTQENLRIKRSKINLLSNISPNLPNDNNSSSLPNNETIRRKASSNYQSTEISLNQGWNFLSLPAVPGSGKKSGEVFGTINTDGHTIWKYDSDTKDWISLNRDTNISPFEGFLIYSDKKASLPFVLEQKDEDGAMNLKPGWNLIGLPFWDAVNASTGMMGVSGDWVSILLFNSSLQAYDPSIIRGASGIHSDTRIIPPFSAFWVYMNGDATVR